MLVQRQLNIPKVGNIDWDVGSKGTSLPYQRPMPIDIAGLISVSVRQLSEYKMTRVLCLVSEMGILAVNVHNDCGANSLMPQ